MDNKHGMHRENKLELNKMNIKEKFIIRSSILELAETGLPRNISIDDKIRIE